jgi:hypothetical protein
MRGARIELEEEIVNFIGNIPCCSLDSLICFGMRNTALYVPGSSLFGDMRILQVTHSRGPFGLHHVFHMNIHKICVRVEL